MSAEPRQRQRSGSVAAKRREIKAKYEALVEAVDAFQTAVRMRSRGIDVDVNGAVQRMLVAAGLKNELVAAPPKEGEE